MAAIKILNFGYLAFEFCLFNIFHILLYFIFQPTKITPLRIKIQTVKSLQKLILLQRLRTHLLTLNMPLHTQGYMFLFIWLYAKWNSFGIFDICRRVFANDFETSNDEIIPRHLTKSLKVSCSLKFLPIITFLPSFKKRYYASILLETTNWYIFKIEFQTESRKITKN